MTQDQPMHEYAHCPYCDKTTKCLIVAVESAREYADTDPIGLNHYLLLQCQGCEDFFFLHVYDDHTNFETERTRTIYPPSKSERFKHHKPNPKFSGLFWLNTDNEFVANLYSQVSKALNQEMVIVAALGMRTLVDAASIKSCNGNVNDNFTKHIKDLVNNGILPTSQQPLFMKIKDICDGATHRLATPSISELAVCMQAVDHLLESIYIQPHRAQTIEKISKVPPRQP